MLSDAPISDALIDAARTLATATRAEPGCIAYNIGLDVEGASALRLSETWRDMTSLRAHFSTPHMAAFRRILDREPGVRTEIDVFALVRDESLAGAGRS